MPHRTFEVGDAAIPTVRVCCLLGLQGCVGEISGAVGYAATHNPDISQRPASLVLSHGVLALAHVESLDVSWSAPDSVCPLLTPARSAG